METTATERKLKIKTLSSNMFELSVQSNVLLIILNFI